MTEDTKQELTVEQVALQNKIEGLKGFIHEEGLVLVPKLKITSDGIVPEISVALKKEMVEDTSKENLSVPNPDAK